MTLERILNDNLTTQDLIKGVTKGWRTELVEIDDVGNEIFLGSNKLLVGGQLFVLEKLFNVDSPFQIQYLNNDLNINVQTNDFVETGTRREKEICLFGVGTDGAEFSQNGVHEVDEKKKGIPVDSMIPFRYVLTTDDLTVEMQDKYFMKKTIGDKYAYYLKKFESVPEIKSRFTDGTPVDANVHTSTKTEDIETYIEIPIKISKEDIREYFFHEQGGEEFAYLNTFAFYAGVYDETAQDYLWVNGVTKININNDHFDNPDKDVSLAYRIFIG